MKTSAALRKHLKAYRIDLYERVRKSTCPVCGAKPGQPCTAKGKAKTWCHGQRHNEARREGFVQGRWFKRP